jgi:PAS domain S-box-containing protein
MRQGLSSAPAALFERLAESMSAVVFELAPDGEVLYVNPAIASVTGHRPDELIGKNWWSELTPSECGDGARRLRQRLLVGDVSRTEISVRAKSGDLVALEISSANAYGPAGAVERIACLGIDVTDRGRSREQIYFQASLLDQVHNAVIATDMAGRILYWNKHAQTLYQWSAAEALGRYRFELLAPPESRAAAENILDCLWRDGDWEGEFQAQRKDGVHVSVHAAETVLRDTRGNLSGFLSVSFDMSAHMRAEQERLALEEQLRQSQKMEAVGRLAGGVAHDFNNLLTIILGFSESLLSAGGLSPSAAAQLREIKKAGDRAASLTRQLVAFSRRQPISLTRLDLNDVVRELEAMLQRLIGAEIELSLDLDRRPCAIEADAGQMSQVLLNLAANARDAMPAGGRLAIVTRVVDADEAVLQIARAMPGPIPPDASAPRRQAPYVMLAVNDTGCGMNEEVKSRAFEPFFTTKPPGKGAGMGLATVYGLVTQCHGHIAVSSEPDRGSDFRIFFPRVELAEAKVDEQQRDGFPRGSETVLVVEDENGVREWASAVLKSCGYRVHAADGPQRALELLQERRVKLDLLVSDVVMPQMGGVQLARLLRRERPALKVLFISGHSDEPALAAPDEPKSTMALQKPFSAHVLARSVRDLLDRP